MLPPAQVLVVHVFNISQSYIIIDMAQQLVCLIYPRIIDGVPVFHPVVIRSDVEVLQFQAIIPEVVIATCLVDEIITHRITNQWQCILKVATP